MDAALVDELRRQHKDLAPSPARERNLDALADGRAAVVVAGQQVGLFGGPAFSLYKAAGAVAAARRLEEETGTRCVPLFWLQGEDHDLDEIDHCFVHDVDGRMRRIAVNTSGATRRVSVAHVVFDDAVERAVEELDSVVRGHPGGADMVKLLGRHYRAGTTPVDAFRGVFAELFAADGLLLFDPRTSAVAGLAAPLLRRSLAGAAQVAAALTARGRELEEAGFAAQVAVIDGAPLAFVHPDGACGPRFRLQPGRAGWSLRGSDVEMTAAEALDLLERDPLRFSTSALLRPVLQDFLLPTALVLAGPGEISYFAQLAPVYEALGVAMPAVVPRPSLCVTGAGDRRRMEQLDLDLALLARGREKLLARLASAAGAAGVDPDAARDALLARFVADLDAFADAALVVDAALARPVARTREAVEQAVSRLVERYRRSVLGRETVAVERLDRLLAALVPGGTWQERVYGLASLGAAHGVHRLLEALRGAIEPFDGAMRELAL